MTETVETVEAIDPIEAPPVATVLRRRRPGRRRQLVWILVLGLAGGLLGLAVGARLEPQAHAEVSVALNPLPGNAFSSTASGVLVDLETESQLPGSDAVLRAMAADGQGMPTPGDDVLRRRLSVSVVPNTQVMVIRYTGSTPQVALDTAKRIAHATLAERTARARAANAQRAEVVASRIAFIKGQVAKLTKSDNGESSDARDQQIKLLSQESVALEAQLLRATSDVGSPGDIISSSTHGDALLKKVRLAILLGCIVFGMIVGAWVGRPPRREN